MNHHFVIDIDDGFVRVLEVEREYGSDGRIHYHRDPAAPSLVRTYVLDPWFYGQLDALLVTPQKIANAKPIVPEAVQS